MTKNATHKKLILATFLALFLMLAIPSFAFAEETDVDTSVAKTDDVMQDAASSSETTKAEVTSEKKETTTEAATTQVTSTTTAANAPAGGERVLEDGHIYIINSQVSGKSMEIAGGSQNNDVATSQYTTNNSAAQQWKVVYDSDNFVTFINVNSNKAIDVAGGDAHSGAKVQQYDRNNTTAQKWIVTKLADGIYMIASAFNSNLVLDVSGGSTADGAQIWLYSANGSNAQKWSFFDVTSGYEEIKKLLETSKNLIEAGVYEITSGCANKVVDVAGGSDSNGANVQTYDSNNSFAQYWRISFDNEGYAYIESLVSGKVLDVSGGSSVPGTNVQQYDKNFSAAQKWVFASNGNGAYRILSALFPGLVLDVAGGSTASGANVQIYSYNASAAQMWTFRKIEEFLDEGYYIITSKVNSSKVVDISGGSHDDSARVQIYEYNQTFAQKWYFTKVSANKFTIQCLESGKYLTANSNGTVYQHTKMSDTSQNWKVYVYAGHYYLTNEMTGLVLDVACGENKDGALVQTYALNWSNAQAWGIISKEAIENGRYFIISSAIESSTVLGIKGGNTADGTLVDFGEGANDTTQKWLFVKNSDGTYTIINAAARKTMDVQNGSATSGTPVQIYTQNDSNAQRWRVVWDSSKGQFVFISALDENLRLSAVDNKTDVGTNVQILTANSSDGQLWHLALAAYISSLRGIDISSWQAGINIYAVDADFVIIKVSQGTRYVNPYWRDWAWQTLNSGKKLGLYHYAEGGNASAEADFFVTQIAEFIGKAILIIDWEAEQNSGYSDHGDWWTSAWRARVKERTGINAWTYISQSTMNNYSGPLWVAQYPDYTPTGYQDNPWNEGAYTCFCRQYTSVGRISGYGGNLDLNKFYGSREDWDAWANGTRA